MLFRAVVVNLPDEGIQRPGFKIDPWEKELFKRNDVLTNHGPLVPGIWYQCAWPTIASTAIKVGNENEFTLFRRPIDTERFQRWENGERFQISDITANTDRK